MSGLAGGRIMRRDGKMNILVVNQTRRLKSRRIMGVKSSTQLAVISLPYLAGPPCPLATASASLWTCVCLPLAPLLQPQPACGPVSAPCSKVSRKCLFRSLLSSSCMLLNHRISPYPMPCVLFCDVCVICCVYGVSDACGVYCVCGVLWCGVWCFSNFV